MNSRVARGSHDLSTGTALELGGDRRWILLQADERTKLKPTAPARDWRRIHHSPMFWIGVVLCLSAIMIYLVPDDLAWHPASSAR
jgi:hypothetical protein